MKARLGGAVGLLVLGSRLAAQTLPVPALPPEPSEPASSATTPPDGSAGSVAAGGLQTPPRPRPWEYSLGAGVDWDSNIGFLAPRGPSHLAIVPRAGLARVFSAGHNRLRASAAGGWTGYPGQSELNRRYGDFGLDGLYRPSPNTRWRVNASYELGYGDTNRILVAQGILLPLVRTQSLSGGLSFSHELTQRTSFRLSGRFYRTAFDSPTLIDGSSIRATAAVDRQLSNRTTAALEYSLEDVLADEKGRAYLTHFGSIQWTRTLTPRSGLLLEAGASYTPDAARAGLEREARFFGGASLTRQVKSSNVTLFLRREVTPAFGLGLSRLELRAGLMASIPIGPAWALRMTATHAQPDAAPTGEQIYGTTDDAFVALGRRLGRRVELAGEARYRRRGPIGSIPLVDAFQGGLFLTVLTPSWRAVAAAPAH